MNKLYNRLFFLYYGKSITKLINAFIDANGNTRRLEPRHIIELCTIHFKWTPKKFNLIFKYCHTMGFIEEVPMPIAGNRGKVVYRVTKEFLKTKTQTHKPPVSKQQSVSSWLMVAVWTRGRWFFKKLINASKTKASSDCTDGTDV